MLGRVSCLVASSFVSAERVKVDCSSVDLEQLAEADVSG